MENKNLDKAFDLLEIAIELEKKDNGMKNIKAASKYYEACALMKKVLNGDQKMDEKTIKLIKEKIEYYEKHALKLLQSKNNCSDRRSIDVGQTFERGNDLSFTEISSSIPTESCRNLNYYPTEPPNQTTGTHSSSMILDKVGKANEFLSNALDLDEKIDNTTTTADTIRNEAIEEYMKASKIYLDCLKIIEQSKDSDGDEYFSNVLKRRLEGALDRVEYLKNASNTTDTATTIPSPKLKSASNEEPSLKLSAAEIEVLKRSSLIASGLFLPWTDEDKSTDFTNKRKLYLDPDGYLKLSPTQKQRFYKWARPSEILMLRSKVIKDDKPVMVQNITPYSIRQTCVTDCSFIASLCICAANERRFHRKLIASIIYPQDASGDPVYNPFGMYMVKLWLNGIARRVTIDDLLPIDKHGNLLCSHTHTSSSSSLELWVSIIEKAYMKLCGGYDFPGSNSGIDLFSLTGWIPERLIFAQNDKSPRDFETPSERAWERLLSASSFGDCLITVSTTSDLDSAKAKEYDLVSDHAYAVLNIVKTDDGQRLLQLKNPWANKGMKMDVNEDKKDDNGVFWIHWSDVLIFFRNFHLSWNPSLFTSRYTIHGSWSNNTTDDSCTFGNNPQYALTMSDDAIHCEGGTSLWILLSRHVNKQEQEGVVASEFLTLHIYRNNHKKERIWYPGGENRVLLGAYTNNPHVLIRYDVTCPSDKYLSLVLSQYNKENKDSTSDLGYTLSCYSTRPFTFGDHVALPKFTKMITCSWDEESAGGNPCFSSFVTNPMWLIQLPKKGSHVMFTVSSSQKIAINVMLCRATKRGALFPLRKDSVVLESGDYRFGFVATDRIFVPNGEYACVVSTFEAQQFAEFLLTVYSTVPLVVSKMP